MLKNQPVRFFAFVFSSLIFCLIPIRAQQTATPLPGSTSSRDQNARALADWVLKEAPSIGCNPSECKILVLNFLMPDGVSSSLGVQLADELSNQLVDTQKEVQVVDRNLLMTNTAESRIDTDSLKSDKEIASFANDLEAGAVIVGKAEKVEGNSFRLFVRFLNTNDYELVVQTEMIIVRTDPIEVTTPEDGDLRMPPDETAAPGTSGDMLPRCYHMPNPPYTDEARAAKFEGVILIDAVILTDGSISDVHIPKSPGLGLDDSIKKTMKDWKCHARKVGGKPVPAHVTFEINFRFYNPSFPN